MQLHSATTDPSNANRILLAYGRNGTASIATAALRLVPSARGSYALRVEPRRVGQRMPGGVLIGGLTDDEALMLAELGAALDGARPKFAKVGVPVSVKLWAGDSNAKLYQDAAGEWLSNGCFAIRSELVAPKDRAAILAWPSKQVGKYWATEEDRYRSEIPAEHQDRALGLGERLRVPVTAGPVECESDGAYLKDYAPLLDGSGAKLGILDARYLAILQACGGELVAAWKSAEDRTGGQSAADHAPIFFQALDATGRVLAVAMPLRG